MAKVTLSVIKADVGGLPGHTVVPEELMDVAVGVLNDGVEKGTLKDFLVTNCGDDLALIMTHTLGDDSPQVHGLAFEAFKGATEEAKKLGLYGAGQDLLSDAFSGNVRGMGPGAAELTITRRPAEPVIIFLMDKTEPGAFNLPVSRMFADPFNTPGLVIDPHLHRGFRFEVWDIRNHRRVMVDTPENLHTLYALVGAKSRYVIKRVYTKPGHKIPSTEPVVSISTEKLSEVAGQYVGKDDPVAVVRAQSGLPAVGEVLEPFSHAHLVSGWMRGSHNGPLMPVGTRDARCTRFDGPPRVVALGFTIAPDLTLTGPEDMFDDPAFEPARRRAADLTDYLRRHGPFEPHRLPLEDMEYTTLPQILGTLEKQWEDVDIVKGTGIKTVAEVE